MGVDRGARLLQALLRLAHLRADVEDVIAGLGSAWASFGGIPRYLVIDNCPPAVATADPLHPAFTRGFLEYSQRRGFIADATRVRHPNVREQARRWCCDVARLRIPGHRTAKAFDSGLFI